MGTERSENRSRKLGERKRAASHAALGFGSATVLLGAFVLAGWAAGLAWIVRPVAQGAVMQPNTALGMILGGAALALAALGWRRTAAVPAGLLGLFALLVLTEHATGADLGMDRLLGTPFLSDPFSPPGRTSASSAVAFAVAALGTLLIAWAPPWRARGAVMGFLSTLLASVPLALVVSYGSGQFLLESFSWVAGTAPHTALGFSLLAAGLFARAWTWSEAMPLRGWSWWPWAVGWLGVVVALTVWQAALAHDRHGVQQTIRREAESVSHLIGLLFLERHEALARMAERWELAGGMDRLRWKRDATIYRKRITGVTALVVLDESGAVRWSVPEHLDRLPLPLSDLVAQPTSVVFLPGERAPRFALSLPLREQGRPSGHLLALLDPGTLFDQVTAKSYAAGYSLSLVDGGGSQLYARLRPGQLRETEWSERATVPSGGLRMRLILWPDHGRLGAMESVGPGAVLALLLTMAVLLTLLSALVRRTGLRAREVRFLNSRLSGQLHEMERVASRLRLSEEHFRRLFENAPIGMALLDTDRRFVQVNARLCRMLGYTGTELIGKTLADITHPDDLDADSALAQRLFAGKIPFYEIEQRYLPKDGGIVNIQLTRTLLWGESGAPELGFAMLQDITERQEAAQALARSNLEMGAAIRELEAFAYSVAHDLRQPLRAITGFAQVLVEDHAAELSSEARTVLDTIVRQAERMGLLIDNLLQLSRVVRKEMTRETIDLTAMATAVVDELQAKYPERRVTAQVAEGMNTKGDPGLVRILLQNLIDNAWKFTRPREEARIEIGSRREPGLTVFFISDNGVGFDMRYADKIFGVFERLHGTSEFEGTGIGLATVNRIAMRHGGLVWTESEPGQGATFFFTLSGMGAD